MSKHSGTPATRQARSSARGRPRHAARDNSRHRTGRACSAALSAGLTAALLGYSGPLAPATVPGPPAASPQLPDTAPPGVTVGPAAAEAPNSASATGPRVLAALDAPAGSPLAAGGIPATALEAYRRAAAAAAPSCHIHWSLIAAIGRVESDHGRFGGAVLHTDGLSSPPIIGIALNGAHGTAVIRDTDGGRLDGDSTYDRAVGPMQFIPSTWEQFAQDGNGDGRRDPFNIFDAARATAVYLCTAGGDLATTAGQARAVLAYNNSASYVASVLSLAAAYAGKPSPSVPDDLSPAPGGPAPANPASPPALGPATAAAAPASGPPSPTAPAAPSSPATSTPAPTTPPTSTPAPTTPATAPPPQSSPPAAVPPATSPASTPTASAVPSPTDVPAAPPPA